VKIAHLVLVLVLLAPATASAQTPPPDERAAAQAFADAAGRFTDAIEAPSKTYFEWLDHPLRRAPGCPRIAKKHRVGAFVLTIYTHTLEWVRDIKPPLRALRSELANVPTADPALISGRAAWRSTGRSVESAPEPGDLCAELRSWRRAGYPRSTVREVTRRFDRLGDSEGGSVSRKQDAAVDRMVELGVPRAEAELFSNPYRDPEELWDGS
jgi:hypothetical protein